MRGRTHLIGLVVAFSTLSVVLADTGGFDLARMAWADKHIEAAIGRGELPGAVLLVGRGNQVVYRKAYGHRAVKPEKVVMVPDTIFDMASVSKPVGCATSIMLLIERGQLNLSDRVSRYFPDFAANGKRDVTVEQLLLHRGGLVPDNSLNDYKGTPAESLAKIFALKTIYDPGAGFDYTDVGYIMLGELVKAVDGRSLDQFARQELFEPLGMKDTGYMPSNELKPRCAPTEQRDGQWMIGEVHDPRAYALGGFAGHAGLFSTADDMARYCRMMLSGGTLDGKRILSELTVREMTRGRCLPDGTGCRGYGFDVSTGFSSARGNLFEAGSTYGHTGFTGTMFWIDPNHDCYVVLLTNAVHPDGKGTVIDLRRRVATVVASALIESPAERYLPAVVRPPVVAGAASNPTGETRNAVGKPAEVLCGIDVLKRDRFKLLEGRRVALITNHTGLDRDGNRTLDLLIAATNVKVVKLFSPEHGFHGKLDEKVSDAVDEKTGLKVYSLYGKTNRPTPEMLEGVDTIVYDIQDVGARFYTYVATMGYAMEEAAKAKLKMIVLDRPNPITGIRVDGPIYDKQNRAFTAFGPLPVVHGMTVGELAGMFNAEYKIGCDLTVVQVEGWKRTMWWDETGLMWVNPSPNMRNLTQATLYPAICLLEGCNLSVGRGTDQPFEFFGAPWIDSRKLAAALNGAKLPGVRFVPIQFVPVPGTKLAGKECQGIYVLLTDRNVFEPVRSGLAIGWHLSRLFGSQFEVDKMNNLVGNAQVTEAVKAVARPDELSKLWREPLDAFKKVRSQYLIYAR
ncbi:MAG TPA: DUF1343 domain-containing protein [Phycisphaerae bacterium]|nr:DUF1343 domain-containing protein [Phycisphaerae bacterium]HRY68763.1 DUF1343 domain-containing protein [Phycisphaerae bacterium]HSA28914.1 DUF1343 domain-containing protein [Phycisphaerae bacterium]